MHASLRLYKCSVGSTLDSDISGKNPHINLILCGSSMGSVVLLGMSMDWLKEDVTAKHENSIV